MRVSYDRLWKKLIGKGQHEYHRQDGQRRADRTRKRGKDLRCFQLLRG